MLFCLLPRSFFCRASYAGRSPGLSVCDYTLWHDINRRMRKTEARWPKDRLETRVQYLAGLRRTAMRCLHPLSIEASVTCAGAVPACTMPVEAILKKAGADHLSRQGTCGSRRNQNDFARHFARASVSIRSQSGHCECSCIIHASIAPASR